MLVAFCDQVDGELHAALLEGGVRRVADHGVADLPLDAVEGVRCRLREAPRDGDPGTGWR